MGGGGVRGRARVGARSGQCGGAQRVASLWRWWTAELWADFGGARSSVSGFTAPVPFGEIIHALSYIPGVTLSGRVEYVKSRGHFGSGRLTIDLATKRYGTVVLGSDGSLRGTLGGISVSLTPAQRTAVDNAGGLGFIATL